MFATVEQATRAVWNARANERAALAEGDYFAAGKAQSARERVR